MILGFRRRNNAEQLEDIYLFRPHLPHIDTSKHFEITVERGNLRVKLVSLKHSYLFDYQSFKYAFCWKRYFNNLSNMSIFFNLKRMHRLICSNPNLLYAGIFFLTNLVNNCACKAMKENLKSLISNSSLLVVFAAWMLSVCLSILKNCSIWVLWNHRRRNVLAVMFLSGQ